MPSRTQLLEDLVQIASENQEDQARTTMVLDDKAQRASTIQRYFSLQRSGSLSPTFSKRSLSISVLQLFCCSPQPFVCASSR